MRRSERRRSGSPIIKKKVRNEKISKEMIRKTN